MGAAIVGTGRWWLIMLVTLAGGERAGAASAGLTDFGERVAPNAGVKPLTLTPFTFARATTRGWSARPPAHVVGARSLGAAVALARSWGRVTSTFRSTEHNRAVGGVPNSYHLRGRAIDLVRARGVSHGELDSMFRAAGFKLVESLDERDHSHFAFAWAGGSDVIAAGRQVVAAASPAAMPQGVTWKWVYAPAGSR